MLHCSQLIFNIFNGGFFCRKVTLFPQSRILLYAYLVIEFVFT